MEPTEMPTPQPAVDHEAAMRALTEADILVRKEQMGATRAQFAMQAIGAVKTYTGEPGELELFIQRMDALHGQIASFAFDDHTARNILGFFNSRVDIAILLEIGATFSSSWTEVKGLLKGKYWRAKRPVSKSVLAILQTTKRPGEAVGEFARRIGTMFKTVKISVADTYTDAAGVTARIGIYEELVKDYLESNLPEKIRTQVKLQRPTKVEDMVRMVLEEQVEEAEERTERRGAGETSWTQVVRRRMRREIPNLRGDGRRFTQSRVSRETGGEGRARNTGVRSAQRTSKPKCWRCGKEGHISRNCGGCWECGQAGHMARNCPLVYRRSGEPARERFYEPMEVNGMRISRRPAERQQSGTETDGESGASSVGTSVRSRYGERRSGEGDGEPRERRPRQRFHKKEE